MASQINLGDPFLIVGIAIQIIVILIANIYTFVNYASPDDINDSYFPKIIIVFSMQVSLMCVLLLPIDVANNAGNPGCDNSNGSGASFCGGINILLMWEVLFMAIGLLLIFFIPFAAFFYLADDGIAVGLTRQSKILPALFNTSVILMVASAMLLGAYFTSGTTSIPVDSYEIAFGDIPTLQYNQISWSTPYQIINQRISGSYLTTMLTSPTTTAYVKYTVTFPIYAIALIGWLGWWLFAIFTGVGLAALPFDLIYDFVRRLKPVSPDMLAEKERDVQTRAAELLDASVAIKRSRIEFEKTNPTTFKRRRRLVQDRVQVNRIAQLVFLLERDTTDLREIKAYNTEVGNPLTPYLKLLAGILFSAVSIMWLMQICLYMLPSPSISPLLNTYFTLFDSWFPIFGVLSFALFSLYLMMCTIKGAFRIGLSFLCIKIYPMVWNGTYVDAFLFNVSIILLCTIPEVQFCLLAFSNYAKYSDIYQVGPPPSFT